jgi:hypothetical protein
VDEGREVLRVEALSGAIGEPTFEHEKGSRSARGRAVLGEKYDRMSFDGVSLVLLGVPCLGVGAFRGVDGAEDKSEIYVGSALVLFWTGVGLPPPNGRSSVSSTGLAIAVGNEVASPGDDSRDMGSSAGP